MNIMDEKTKPSDTSPETSSDATEPRKSYIVDITDQFVGKAFIITGVGAPKLPATWPIPLAAIEELFGTKPDKGVKKPPEK